MLSTWKPPKAPGSNHSPSYVRTTVTRITNGNTFEVRDCASCRTYTIRLSNVWVPETPRRGSSTAKDRLEVLISPGTRITFTRTQYDLNGIKVGDVSVSGISINSRMRAYGYTSNLSLSTIASASRPSATSRLASTVRTTPSSQTATSSSPNQKSRNTSVTMSSSSNTGTRVTRIIDGDTIEVRDCASCSAYRIRLANVWAPETHERGGSTATSRLRSLIPPGTRVTFTRTQSDSYGRKVGNVSVSGTSVNSRMRSYGYTSNSSNSSSSGSTRSTTFSGSSRSTGSSYSGSCDTSQRTYRGSPGYHPSQDRDNDGIGCECGCGSR